MMWRCAAQMQYWQPGQRGRFNQVRELNRISQHLCVLLTAERLNLVSQSYSMYFSHLWMQIERNVVLAATKEEHERNQEVMFNQKRAFRMIPSTNLKAPWMLCYVGYMNVMQGLCHHRVCILVLIDIEYMSERSNWIIEQMCKSEE